MTQPVCDTCKRPLPKEKSDDPPTRSVFAVSEPTGEHGSIAELLGQVNDRYVQAGSDLVPAGEKTWKFKTLHYLLYAVATAPPEVFAALVPKEEGA